jgi:hypothetical protein
VVAITDGWPRGFNSIPCQRSARLQRAFLQAPDGSSCYFSLSIGDSYCFPISLSFFTQIPAVEDFVLWYPLIQIAPSAGRSSVSLSIYMQCFNVFWLGAWVSISTTPATGSPTCPRSFNRSHLNLDYSDADYSRRDSTRRRTNVRPLRISLSGPLLPKRCEGWTNTGSTPFMLGR